MILKLNKEYEISYSMDNLMDDDFVIVLELSLFASNTKNNNIWDFRSISFISKEI